MNPTQELIKISEELTIYRSTKVVLEDWRFPLWSGSSESDKHHYGQGGLAKHTLEVTRLCLKTNEEMGSKADKQLLTMAAIFHDYGKIWDYEQVNEDSYDEWRGTIHKRRIYHINRSAFEWMDASRHLTPWQQDTVAHAILSHHGLRQWGSSVAPNMPEAWILHLCDSISARLDDWNRKDRLS